MKLKKLRPKPKPAFLGATGWKGLDPITDRDLSKVHTATCDCGEPILHYRTKCTECIEKEVKKSIGSHTRNARIPMSLTNYEALTLKSYS